MHTDCSHLPATPPNFYLHTTYLFDIQMYVFAKTVTQKKVFQTKCKFMFYTGQNNTVTFPNVVWFTYPEQQEH